MKENDKYPDESGRQRFVKGVVGSSALAGIGTASAAMVETATSPTGEGGGTTSFFGIENTDGPAPREMPQIPIKIDSQGNIKGVYPEVKRYRNESSQLKQRRRRLAEFPILSSGSNIVGYKRTKGYNRQRIRIIFSGMLSQVGINGNHQRFRRVIKFMLTILATIRHGVMELENRDWENQQLYRGGLRIPKPLSQRKFSVFHRIYLKG